MSNKPKVLLIATFPPPVHGSSKVSQVIIDSELINEKFDIDCVNLSTSRRMDEIGKNSPIKLLRFFISFVQAFYKLAFHSYDLCYLAITCHDKGFLKDSPYLLISRFLSKRRIIHQHNKGASENINQQPYKWLMPMAYKDAKVMLLSWRLYPDVVHFVKKEQVLICPNGLPEMDAENTIRINKVPRILYLSNLVPSKGVYVLLDALRILCDRKVNFECNFVGGESLDINSTIFNKALEVRQLTDSVHYLGRQYGDDKNQRYSESDIFVLPSMDDCLPLTIIEAMQQSLPVVSTDVGAVLDLVLDGESGLISKQGNAEDLANKLQMLIESKELREKYGKRGYELYKEKFSLSVFEHTYVECLKDAIK